MCAWPESSYITRTAGFGLGLDAFEAATVFKLSRPGPGKGLDWSPVTTTLSFIIEEKWDANTIRIKYIDSFDLQAFCNLQDYAGEYDDITFIPHLSFHGSKPCSRQHIQ